MPTLVLSGLNAILSALGGWLLLFGLVSYLCKETLYLSEALISLLIGVAFSPPAANWLRPLSYVGESQTQLDAVTLAFSRIVLDVQLVLVGVQLPRRYLWEARGPLGLLLGPLMVVMWLAASFVVWLLVPAVGGTGAHIPFLHALAIGSCITPTDPVLSNVIVHGRFADKHMPPALRNMVIAESGANDGLGYPFLFLALYLLQNGVASGGRVTAATGGTHVAHAIGLWFGETLGYTILLSVVYGAVVGHVARVLLRAATARRWVERESFVLAPCALALFVAGTGGLMGTDDVLASFVAGNVFTWDDWFRRATHEDNKDILQPTVDMVLNVLVFLWYGAVCPWSLFVHGPVSLGRLVGIGLLVLVVRRLPWLLALWRWLPAIETVQQAVFVGFFGPMGVSAVFYLYVMLEFLDQMLADTDGGRSRRPDVAYLGEATTAVVWFCCISSVVVHGLAIPLGMGAVALPGAVRRLRAEPWRAAAAAATATTAAWDGVRAWWAQPAPAKLAKSLSFMTSTTSLSPKPPQLAQASAYPSPPALPVSSPLSPLSPSSPSSPLSPSSPSSPPPLPPLAPGVFPLTPRRTKQRPPPLSSSSDPVPEPSSLPRLPTTVVFSSSVSVTDLPAPHPSDAAVGPSKTE